jgi:hypothetical protein
MTNEETARLLCAAFRAQLADEDLTSRLVSAVHGPRAEHAGQRALRELAAGVDAIEAARAARDAEFERRNGARARRAWLAYEKARDRHEAEREGQAAARAPSLLVAASMHLGRPQTAVF